MSGTTNLCGVGDYLQIPNYTDSASCNLWTKHIIGNRDKWKSKLDAYTYGNAWYLEIETGCLHSYHAEAEASNKLVSALPAYLPTMIDTCQFLAPKDNNGKAYPIRARTVNLGPYWSWSGLHIFEANEEVNGGAFHCDYEGLAPYPQKLFEEETRAYSAVLSVAAPESGGGLRVWPRRFLANEEIPYMPDEEAVDLDYQPGTLTILDSFMGHQIMESEFKPDQLRITGVIHWLLLDDPYPHWEYWF